MKSPARMLLAVVGAALIATTPAWADTGELRFGVGLYQPDKEKNDATYRPLAAYLAKRLGRPVKLRAVSRLPL